VAEDAPPAEPKKPSARRVWIQRGLMALGLGLVAYMISRFPLSAIADACLDLGFWVFVTPLIGMCWFAASSTALYNLLEGKVPWRALMWNRFVGEGYNALIPAAGMGGEPFKLRQLTRYVDTQRAVVALINDRLIENAIALVFSALCVGIGQFYLDVSPSLRTTMVTYAIVASLVAIVISILMVTNLTGRIGGRITRWITGSTEPPKKLPILIIGRAFLWTLVARSLSLVEIALLFKLLDVEVTVTSVMFTGGALSAAGFVGGVIPQGLGVAEAASVGIFELLHFPGPAGVAFALARRGRTLVMSVAGVLCHLAFGRRIAAAAAPVPAEPSSAGVTDVPAS
jgi:Lysylphosphatidylglycerol synthase TM region